MATVWTTAGQPPAGRFAFWREAVCEAFLALAPEPGPRTVAGSFGGEIASVPLGDVGLARVRSQAQLVRRTRREIARSPDDGFYVFVQLQGRAVIRQGRNAAPLRVGDATVLDTGRPYELDFHGDFEQAVLRVPYPLLRPLLDVPAAQGRRIDGARGLGQVVRPAVLAMAALPERSPVLLGAAVPHLLGLIGAAAGVSVGATSPVGAAAGRVGPDAVFADIDTHLDDPGLSPTATAGRLGVSVRLVHLRCAEGGTSYGRHVLARRLERCRDLLMDPAHRHRTIAQIAVSSGFRDVSHFARVFRVRYGCSPSASRRAGG